MSRQAVGILMIALAVAGGLSLVASDAPDGLEHSMERVGAAEGEPVLDSPMPGYEAPFWQNSTARKTVAGLSGTLAVLGLALLVGWTLRRAGR